MLRRRAAAASKSASARKPPAWMPSTAQRSSTSLTSPVTPRAPTISPDGSRINWPPPSRNSGPSASADSDCMKAGFSLAFCRTCRDDRLSASAPNALPWAISKRISDAPSCFWNAFTRPPASSTIAASACVLRFVADAKVPLMILFASARVIARIPFPVSPRGPGFALGYGPENKPSDAAVQTALVPMARMLVPPFAQRACLAAATLALALALGGAAAAEPAYSFAATPGKLPKTVVPTHYAIELEPDLEKLTLAGAVVANIEVRESTARVVVNAVGMTLASGTADETLSATVALDAAAETATLTFPQPLAVGPHKLRIGFTGAINRFGRGLFYVDYPTETGKKRMISSHLEPADARRVFPCWDEPAFKATFALTVTVPRHHLAVSNMPVAHEEPVTPSLKQVTFATTPKMSSYLFVLAAGELERLSVQADGVTVSVVATAGKRGEGRFALDTAVDLLRYFNDYFGIKYPLPKLDLIAVPGGFGGAMENWGGITFFESRLLFDPATSAADSRRGIFGILAHEMAHMWFGDLVTMAWWDNLWLNEGFATWMQSKAAEHFYPQWRTWLNDNGSKQFAMNLDARRSSHPIQQPVANETEAMAVFDGITYSKGQALIRMLESYD